MLFLALFLSQGCSRREPEGSGTRAAALLKSGDYPGALEAVHAAMAQIADQKKDSLLGEYYLMAAKCHRWLGQYDSVLGCFQEALMRFHSVGDQALERKGKIALAEFYSLMNNDAAALSLASDAAASAKVFSDAAGASNALEIAAEANHRLGKFDREMNLLEELVKADSLENRSMRRAALMVREMRSLATSGRRDLALSVLDKLTSGPPDSSARAAAFYQLGLSHQLAGNRDSALLSFSRALGLTNTDADRPMQAKILSMLGCLAYRSRNYDDARMHYGDALGSSGEIKDVMTSQMLRLMMVACDWKSQRGKSAEMSSDFIKRCDDILTSCRQTGFRMGEAFALFVKARITEQGSQPDTALPLYIQALDAYEQTRVSFPEGSSVPEMIDAFMDGEKSSWYIPALHEYCSRGKCSEAFSVAERRNLYGLNRFFSGLTFKTSDERINRSVSRLVWQLNAQQLLENDIIVELSSGRKMDYAHVEALMKNFPYLAGEVSSAAEEVGKSGPNFRWLLHQKAPLLDRVRDTLPENSALLEYVPLSDTLYVIVATRDTSVMRRAAVSSSHITELAMEFEKLIGDPHLNESLRQSSGQRSLGRIRELARVLANFLIEPVISALGNVQKLYIVLPEEFGWLPFHVLRTDAGVLVDRFAVSYLPTSAVLYFSHKAVKPVTDIIGVGHPGRTDWDVEYELKDIRGFYDKAKMLFYTSATKRSLDASAYDVLHFAAEFTLDMAVPDNSALILSDGTTPYGVRELALGEALGIPPPEVLIFSNISPLAGSFWRYAPLAFQAGGVPVLIATMWQGERKAKKYFGEVFYTSLQAGVPAAQAYQNAMMALAKNQEFSQPHRWGLYYIFGR